MSRPQRLALLLPLIVGCAATTPAIAPSPAPSPTASPAALPSTQGVSTTPAAIAPAPDVDTTYNTDAETPNFRAYAFARDPGPSPEPLPTPLPQQEAGYYSLWGSPLSLRVGETVAFQFRVSGPNGSPATASPVSWGVLEGDRARIDSDGRLTGLAPGRVHVYAEKDGKRAYAFVAVREHARSWFELDPPNLFHDYMQPIGSEWATYLQSADDWRAFCERVKGSPLPAEATPPPIDFADKTILAVHLRADNSDPTFGPFLTEVVEGARPTYRFVFAGHPHSVSNGEYAGVNRFIVLPKRSGDATVEVERLYPRGYVPSFGLSTVRGPSPVPSMTPTPLATNRPAPFPLPPPDAATCDPQADWAPGSRDLELRWAGAGRGYSPVLEVGNTLRLEATSNLGPVSFDVADPTRAAVGPDGQVTALKAGPIEVIATAGDRHARALAAAVASPRFLTVLDFGKHADAPSVAAPRSPRVITTSTAFQRFLQLDLATPLPRELWPSVDFNRYSIVVVVRDRPTRGEGLPVVTTFDDRANVVELVTPGIEGPARLTHEPHTYVFAVRDQLPGAKVREYSLCQPLR